MSTRYHITVSIGEEIYKVICKGCWGWVETLAYRIGM